MIQNLFKQDKGKGKASGSGSDSDSDSATNKLTPNPNVFFDIDNDETGIDDIFINTEQETNF